ncbi:MAG: spondin domain-containing protein [Pseudomonadota bacterium]
MTRNLTSPLARAAVLAAALMFCAATAVTAATLKVEVTNNQASGGLSLTPFFTAFHDGSFDTFDPGGRASDYLELLAEEGDPSGALGAAASAGATAGVAAAPGGFPGAPVIEPGETASLRITVDPSSGRYLSFLSMVIPSNDLFVGNSDPFAYEVFDGSGAFTNLADIFLTTANVYDAGTEANNNLGAAFNTAGGDPTETDDPIALVGDLAFLLGQGTPIGPVTNIGVPLASISVSQVPLPPGIALSLAGLGLLGAAARRRKTA